MRDQKEAAGPEGAEQRAQQIGPKRVFPNREQHGPDVRNQHEQRRPRRMRYAERFRRRDELAGIPERDRRSEGKQITQQDQTSDPQGGRVGRPGSH